MLVKVVEEICGLSFTGFSMPFPVFNKRQLGELYGLITLSVACGL